MRQKLAHLGFGAGAALLSLGLLSLVSPITPARAERVSSHLEKVSAQDQKPPRCFPSRDIIDFISLDDRSMMIRDRFGAYYLLAFSESCPKIHRAHDISIESRVTPNEVCGPNDALIHYDYSPNAVTCPVSQVTPMTETDARLYLGQHDKDVAEDYRARHHRIG